MLHQARIKRDLPTGLQAKGMSSRTSLPNSSATDDDLILKVANEARQKLRLSPRINPRRIVWSKGAYPDESDLTPGVRRTGLLLSEALRGKLSPEEWRPIIIASLIRFTDGRKFLRILSRALLLLAVIAGIGFLANTILGPSLEFLVLPVAIFLLFLMLRDTSRWLKGESLKLDSRTASIVGRDVLLGTLRRVQTMHLLDVEQLNERRGFTAKVVMAARPSLSERILFLETIP